MSDQILSSLKVGTPLILGVAESVHYRVGLVDENKNLTGIGNSEQAAVVGSFTEAKQYLSAQHIHMAAVEYQTAYDEFCGGATNQRCWQMITF